MLYRIVAIKNCFGQEVGKEYKVKCGAHLELDDRTKTLDVNKAYICLEDLHRTLPRGQYYVEETK